MENITDGIVAPLRGESYKLMREWIRLFRSYSVIYIYGAGKRGKLLLNWLMEEQIEVTAFIDSDIRMQGKIIEGLPVLSEKALSENCKVIVSPYEYKEIEDFLKNKGYRKNEDYFIARQINIPVITSEKIIMNNDLFHNIRCNAELGNGAPVPVYVGNKIIDYYKIDYSMTLFGKVLNWLLNDYNENIIQYIDFHDGILLREWNELSEKIMCYFMKYRIPVLFDTKLLHEGYSDIDIIKDNACDVEDDAQYFIVEQNYVFLTELLKYNDLSKVIPYCMQLQKEGIHFAVARIPEFEELENISADEKYRSINAITGYSQFYDEREDQIRQVYGEDYEKWKNREIGNITQYYVGDIAHIKDTTGKFTNVINGIRRTAYQPSKYKNKVYMIGPCIIGGAYVSDENTIPSILQKCLNDILPNTYKVENLGICGGPRSYIERVKKLDLYQGDYLIFADIFSKGFMQQYEDSIFIDLLDAFNKRTRDVFFEKTTHMNKFGNLLVGREIYSHITWNIDDVETKCLIQKGSLFSIDVQEEFENYKKSLQDIIREIPDVTACVLGGIVMNCNPFTYGHLYLIEQALIFVDYLFIFVVEEDKSYFPFEKRIEMVREACSRFDNVNVIPSGKIVLSSYTMPEYFRKDDLQNVEVDPTKDVEIFAKMIAPELHITKRFVGEEPFDTVTRQYNECMKEILPKNGIELIEIPRYKKNEEFVSASKVRKLLETDIELIHELVPESTYIIIKEMME